VVKGGREGGREGRVPSSRAAGTSTEEEEGRGGESVEEAEEHDEKRQQMEETKEEEEEEEEEQGRAHSVRPYMAVRENPESMKKRGMILEAVVSEKKVGGREGERMGVSGHEHIFMHRPMPTHPSTPMHPFPPPILSISGAKIDVPFIAT
jgi:hypothetical protein